MRKVFDPNDPTLIDDPIPLRYCDDLRFGDPPGENIYGAYLAAQHFMLDVGCIHPDDFKLLLLYLAWEPDWQDEADWIERHGVPADVPTTDEIWNIFGFGTPDPEEHYLKRLDEIERREAAEKERSEIATALDPSRQANRANPGPARL